MTAHKALFLDIDGVMINGWSEEQPHELWFNENMRPFSLNAVKALNSIVTQSNAVLVISSGWRHELGYEGLIDCFAYNKLQAHPYPLAYDFRGNFEAYENARYLQRCKEIESYLRTHNPDGFAIIDDIYIPCFPEHQVNPEPQEGLADAQVQQVLDMLEQEPVFPE